MLRSNILLKYVKNNGIWMNSRKKINNSSIRCISNTVPTQGGSVYNNKNEIKFSSDAKIACNK